MGPRADGWTDAIAGAVAGGIATAAMSAASSALYRREGWVPRFWEDWARGGRSAHATAVEKLAAGAGIELSDSQRDRAATIAHYAIGSAAAALYGTVRRAIPLPAPLKGAAFGGALWLLADEIATPAAGITPGPSAFPWQTHARGLAAHLVYGLTSEAVLSAIDRLAGRS
jgi:hypothetical protein